MSYWDINEFLAEEEMLPFSFLQDSPGMGFMDPPKAIEGPVQAGQVLNSPLWMISTAHAYLDIENQDQMLKVHIPDFFNIKHEQRMRAFKESDRGSVQNINLSKQSMYYFQVYDLIKGMTKNNPLKIEALTIKDYFQERAKLIMSRGFYTQGEAQKQSASMNYTNFENNLYRQIKEIARQYDRWRSNIR